VTLHNPKGAWTKYCRCVTVTDGEYEYVTNEPPPNDFECKAGGLALESKVLGNKREYEVRCLGKCEKGEKCEPKIDEKWETKTDKDGWEQDVRIV